jgi:AcrR family transcriptional regulator
MPSEPAPETPDAQEGQEATTRERILRAFLRLAAERGFEATTTRAVAEEAGVNEVTIFRQFTDKMTLARDAIRWQAPVARLSAYTPAIDASSPTSALAGLLACMRVLRATLQANRGLVQFGMSDAWRYPDLLREVELAPLAARGVLARALETARPALRPEVDVAQSAMGLIALIFVTVLWESFGWLRLSDGEWDSLFLANLRVLLRDALPGAGADATPPDVRGNIPGAAGPAEQAE